MLAGRTPNPLSRLWAATNPKMLKEKMVGKPQALKEDSHEANPKP